MSIGFQGGDLELPDPLAIAAAAAEVEQEMRVVLRVAGEEAEADMRGRIHSRSGKLAAAVVARVRLLRGDSGARLSVGPTKAVEFATRKGREGAVSKAQDVFTGWFVEEGTGIYGPQRQLIKRRGRIPVGRSLRVPSGRGQQAQHIFRDAREDYAATKAPAVDRRIQELAARKIGAAVRQGVRR